jgi:ATP-dependent Clp protease ATP-binding subunit ClpC
MENDVQPKYRLHFTFRCKDLNGRMHFHVLKEDAMEDFGFDIPQNRLAESGERVIDEAFDLARRLRQGLLTNDHICLAYIQVEWGTFANITRRIELDPHEITREIEKHLDSMPETSASEVRVSPASKLLFKMAMLAASRRGHHQIESIDLLLALLEDSQCGFVLLLRQKGVDLEALPSRISKMLENDERQREKDKRRFELPPFLRHFATNLNELARQDKTPPLFGRESEIGQVCEVLSHIDRSNSAMLIGEPGVGKTAIAEGLARLIELEPEKVPLRLRNCQIVNLQMNTMVAGTMLRGMFEDRIQSVIREIKERPNMILFIDEIHTMIGAGSALGAPSDAANIFKQVLARGEVRIIGATTIGEYKEFIEPEEALARRFRTVIVRESSIDETRIILYNLRPRLERNYAVKIKDEAIEKALEMSSRYVRHLRLPDKVIGWLDTASVKAEINSRRDVVADDVVTVISQVSGIPKDMVLRQTSKRFQDLEQRLGRRVVGQRRAIEAVARQLVLNKGPMKDGFDRPDGVLLFLGSTGVGKTELAKAVAEFLFGDERRMIRIDMSEYQDSLAVDKLIGSHRGIVGAEKGGVLTNKLKDSPYSVLLLDEIEKASPNVLNLFLQAFDEGWITDGLGRRVYLSDTLIIMTSNVGSAVFEMLGEVSETDEAAIKQVYDQVGGEAEKYFSPEFRNRIDEIVVFWPLDEMEVTEIAINRLNEIEASLRENGRTWKYSSEVLDLLISQGYSRRYGARHLKRTIDRLLKTEISRVWDEGQHFDVSVQKGEIKVVVSKMGSEAAAV